MVVNSDVYFNRIEIEICLNIRVVLGCFLSGYFTNQCEFLGPFKMRNSQSYLLRHLLK